LEIPAQKTQDLKRIVISEGFLSATLNDAEIRRDRSERLNYFAQELFGPRPLSVIGRLVIAARMLRRTRNVNEFLEQNSENWMKNSYQVGWFF